MCLLIKIQKDCNEKSKFHSIVDAIERVTGLDLDGDGTVAGDIICQVSRNVSAFLQLTPRFMWAKYSARIPAADLYDACIRCRFYRCIVPSDTITKWLHNLL